MTTGGLLEVAGRVPWRKRLRETLLVLEVGTHHGKIPVGKWEELSKGITKKIPELGWLTPLSFKFVV